MDSYHTDLKILKNEKAIIMNPNLFSKSSLILVLRLNLFRHKNERNDF